MKISDIIKSMVPYSGTPTAPRERSWNATAALTRFRKWAGGPDAEKISWAKYRRMFVRFDAESAKDFEGYIGPHHDILDGDPHTIFRGVAAIAVFITGGRTSDSWPDEEVAGIKAHIEKHYKQFDEQAPWQREEKDFDWLPEEHRAAKALGLDPTETQTALFAPDGAGVAKEGRPREDGSKAMPDNVLIIRNDADVSEEIETPADGVFDEDVAAVSLDDGETWLELEGGRIKDEPAGDPAEGEGDPGEGEGDPAEGAGDPGEGDEPAGDPAEGDGDPAEGDPAEGDGDPAEGDPAEGDGDPAEGDPAEGDGKGSQPDIVLDYSLLGELAETGYMRYLWNLTYALSDVLVGLIGDDELSVDEKTAKSDKALTEFAALAKSSFSEAATIAADEEPDDEDPFAGMSFADIVRAALAEADGLDLSDASSEDVNAIAAEVTELQTKLTDATEQGSIQQGQLDEAKRLIDLLLDMPMERKLDGDTDGDAAADINDKYPWLDPMLRRKLAAVKVN
jgi:hypothetical protein